MRIAPRFVAAPLVALVLAGTLSACGSGDEGAAGGGPAAVREASGATPHLDAVAAQIRKMEAATGSDTSEGVLWGVSEGNELPGAGTGSSGFLVRTTDCWGKAGACDSSGVQKAMLAQMRGIIAGGKVLVDVASLAALADGGFRQAIVDGVAEGAKAGNAPTVRLMWGRSPASPFKDGALRQLQAEVQQANPKATVVAALMANTAVLNGYSWNHAKIVAADSTVAIASGINLWARSYLQSDNPITDVGVEVRGPAAARAQTFLDVLWRFTCANEGFTTKYNNTIAPKGGGNGGCTAKAPVPGPATGGVKVLAVGRAGYVKDGRVTGRNANAVKISAADQRDSKCYVPPIPNDMNGSAKWDGNNPSDTALRALVESATSKVVVAQQMLTFPCATTPSYDVRLIDALARKVAQGVPVTIVVSDPKSTISALETYAGDPKADRKVLMKRLEKIAGSKAKARELACRNLTVAPFRFSDAGAWPNGTGPGHHGKVIAVDDAAFYVGSQNAYPTQQPEFGWIIEDPTVMADFRRDYLDPLVTYSSKAAVPCT